MPKLSELRSDHRIALRMAWLDLCHAHEALGGWEPDITALIRAAVCKLHELYPDISATLRRTHPDERED